MADEQRETENGTVPEQTKGVNVKVYMGRDREEAFWNDVREYNEPMLSPGGVAQRLHCTRQFVSSLVKKGQLKALAFYLKEGSKPAYMMIPLSDVERYAARVGKGQPSDFDEIAQEGDKGRNLGW